VLQTQTLAEYAITAHGMYARLHGAWKGSQEAFEARFGSEPAFVTASVGRIQKQMHPVSYFEALLSCSYSVTWLPLRSLLEGPALGGEGLLAEDILSTQQQAKLNGLDSFVAEVKASLAKEVSTSLDFAMAALDGDR